MEAKIDIEKVRKGDHAAFKTFFECFYPKLMALACRFVDEQVERFGARSLHFLLGTEKGYTTRQYPIFPF